MLRRPALVLTLAAFSSLSIAAQPQFWEIEGARELLAGDADGVSIDSEGRLRLAPELRALPDPEAPFVWSLARSGRDVLFLGTGNDGKVFRVEKGEARLFFDAPELEVHALAARDGKLYVGTSPDGKVHAVSPDGTSTTFFDPPERYVWALAFDPEGRLLVATGADGRVHRVEAGGKSEVLLTTPEAHVTALHVGEDGTVHAGTSPGGILYRVDPAGKVLVLHDSPYREVKALDVGPRGDVYAALVEGKEREERPAATPVPAAAAAAVPVTEVTVTESFTVVGPAGPAPVTPSPAPPSRPEPPRGGNKGALVRIPASGEVDTLWSSTEEMPQSILAVEGGALLGTGDKGKVYRVLDDRTWVMLADLPAEQATALLAVGGGATAIATSNPGGVHVLGARPGPRGTLVSKVKDAEAVSRWGLVRWQASAPPGTAIELATRSGDTSSPDDTWSPWSAPLGRAEGEPIPSPAARYLQARVTLSGKDGATPLLESATAAYLQRNLRPLVTSITVHGPGEVFQKPISVTGEVEILGAEPGPPPEPRPGVAARPLPAPVGPYSRKLYQKGMQTVSWKAEDPNGDQLSFDVAYRRVGDPRTHLLRRGAFEPVVAWDTTTVPSGRYVVRVSVTDSPGNPDAQALDSSKESEPFAVDNTPPQVTATLGKNGRLRATVRDDSSVVRRTEHSIDGGRWEEVHPVDGIADGLEESFDLSLPKGLDAGPHVVVVRATDLLGNVATARVEIP